MHDFHTNVKEKLNSIIKEISENHWLFSYNPGHDFMRQDIGKLSFFDTMRLIIGMGKGSTNDEIMDYFDLDPDLIPTQSAFIQRRSQISLSAARIRCHFSTKKITLAFHRHHSNYHKSYACLLTRNSALCPPSRTITWYSGILDIAPSLQWRDRAGFSPASILASILRCSGQIKEHKTFIHFYHNNIITVSSEIQPPFLAFFSDPVYTGRNRMQ